MDKFVTRISDGTPGLNPNPALQKPSDTPSTSSSVSSNVTTGTGTPVDLNLFGPSRPKLNSFPKDKNNRCFRSVWYNQFSWLEYSVCKDAAYCFPCRRFLPHTRETGFTVEGYNNWKRAVGDKKKGLLKHDSTHLHILAMAKWTEFQERTESNTSISTLVNDEALERNRYYVSSVIQVVQFLVVHELALRGSWDKIHHLDTGLFTRLFEYTLKKDSKLKAVYDTIPQNAKYTSWKIQNEVIEIMKSVVVANVAEDVKNGDVEW